MFFVVDKPKFQRVISIVRDDRTRARQGLRGAYVRIEASGEHVKIESSEASGKFPATVYEPGVLFLKITLFRRLLRTITKEPFLTIQATADSLLVERIELPFETNDMWLYPDPASAPPLHSTEKSLSVRGHPDPAGDGPAKSHRFGDSSASVQLLFCWKNSGDGELTDDGGHSGDAARPRM